MKIIVTFSGGKDSLAALLWVREHITTNFTTVFCDTGWEHPLTYEYINRIADRLNLDLVTLKSPKYDGMVGLAKQKKRWPSTRARFCTQELKTKPCIDYVLDNVQDNILMIQGIRAAESPNRAAMSSNARTLSTISSHTVMIKRANQRCTPIAVTTCGCSESNTLTIYCVPYSIGRRSR